MASDRLGDLRRQALDAWAPGAARIAQRGFDEVELEDLPSPGAQAAEASGMFGMAEQSVFVYFTGVENDSQRNNNKKLYLGRGSTREC